MWQRTEDPEEETPQQTPATQLQEKKGPAEMDEENHETKNPTDTEVIDLTVKEDPEKKTRKRTQRPRKQCSQESVRQIALKPGTKYSRFGGNPEDKGEL